MRRQSSRLFIVDFDLVDYSGHFFNQVFGFREAALALGLKPHIFVPKSAEAKIIASLDAHAILPEVIWHVADRDAALQSFVEAHATLRTLWSAIEAQGISTCDILLITSSRPAVMHALGAWLSTLRPRSHPVIFFRFFGAEFLNFQTMDYNAQAWTFQYASQELTAKRGEERIFLTINNRRLVPHLEALVLRRAFFMPMPKYYGDAGPVQRNGALDSATIYVHANRAGEMPQRVGTVVASILQDKTRVKFLVRFCKYAGASETAHEAIEKNLIGNGLELLPAEEDHLQYLAAIERSDIVLLPYDPIEYRGITSGPFCEAAAHGKVLVVPDGTWMADQIKEGHASGILFSQPTAGDIAAAITQALRDLPSLQAEAFRLADAFRAENSCRRNLELMLNLADQPQDMRLSYVPPANLANPFVLRSYLRGGWSTVEAGSGVWTAGSVAELIFRMLLVLRSYLRGGWSAVEADSGVWTAGSAAELIFRMQPSPDSLILRAQLLPFLARQKPELRVRVCSNERQLAEWSFSMSEPADRTWCWREATIPADIAAKGDIPVTLHIDRTASPRELGLSDDSRQLGVMLRELSLAPAPASTPV